MHTLSVNYACTQQTREQFCNLLHYRFRIGRLARKKIPKSTRKKNCIFQSIYSQSTQWQSSANHCSIRICRCAIHKLYILATIERNVHDLAKAIERY